MSLIRYTPFNDFATFPAGLRIFQDSVNQLLAQPSARPWVPSVDILESENELVLTADVPGLDLKDIGVHVENGTLTLRGERKFEHKEAKENGKNGGYHRLERSYGAFERAFTLPETFDVEAVKADYRAGVLTITLPKKEIAKPRQIKVNINGSN